ncbi:uncharacterized protein LOC141933586 isoform X5 [Strix aluco]|uniref:uncharacterized protein LOC141933586 isoform X5 n=1 Tax=Strix aluco TaxID=111821 RepID=UPI003DA66AE7
MFKDASFCFSSMWIRRVLLGAILGALSPGHRPPRQVAVLSVRLCSDSSRLPLFIHQGASADIKAAFCFTWAKQVSQSPEGDQRALAYRENEPFTDRTVPTCSSGRRSLSPGYSLAMEHARIDASPIVLPISLIGCGVWETPPSRRPTDSL